jgi:methyltransferase
MNTSITIYFVLVACVAAQRILELRIASRNTRRLLALGAREFKSPHYKAMKVLHSTWLVACLLEAWWRGAPPHLAVSIIAIGFFTVGQVLRFAAMRDLGPRWTTRIIVLPEVPPVAGGIYRWIKHPNYLGVILEIAALPIVFGCWFTAVLYSLANLILLLAVRIPAEESALTSNNNDKSITEWSRRGRFVPGRS